MDDPLIDRARDAQANAHAPYSGFPVGAALEGVDGRVFVGANVECASFGLTNCAERVALGAAVAAGVRRFKRLALVTESAPPAPPCGACRQALAEFGLDLVVDSWSPAGYMSWRLRDLLPYPFGSSALQA